MSSALHPPCDAAAAHGETAPATTEHPRLILLTTIAASSLAFIDGSVVNVGLPAIGRSLGAGASDLQWIVNAYLLPLSALLLFGGAAGDRFGRRNLLIGGTLLFALSSAACAFSSDLVWLLIGRFLQGIGAAILMPNSLAILGQTFSGQDRGRAVGIWAATGAIAGAFGPILGGWLIDAGSWRLIFMINLPLAAIAMLLAWLYVPVSPKQQRTRLDLPGALLATVGLGLLTVGLTHGTGREGWSNFSTVTVVLGIILLIVFVLVERRRGEQAMMPLALFSSASFVGLTALTLMLYGALAGLLVLLPFVLIEAAGYSGTKAGAALLPLPIILAIMSPLIGSIAGRVGPRLPLTVGPLLVAVGFLMMCRIAADGAYWTTVLPAIIVISLGMSGAVAPLTTAVLSTVDARHTGSASGFNSAVARTGGLIATALVGGILAANGDAIIAAFHIGAAIGAGACVSASLSAFILLRRSDAVPSHDVPGTGHS